MSPPSLRKLVLAAAVLAAVATTTPANANPTQTWVRIGGGVASLPPVTDPGVVDDLLALVGGLAQDAGGRTCTPKTATLHIHDLRWTAWLNPENGDIAYWWRNAGTARVSTDCASSVNVTVQISDLAPWGRPIVVRGEPQPNSSSAPSGGELSTSADADLWVVYYSPLNLYQRGTSLVEVKVIGSYYNTAARRTLSIGCILQYTPVTPTPNGPILGSPTRPEKCAG